jgi:hypothetical protein
MNDVNFVQGCEYVLELNSHSELMLAWRYGVKGTFDGDKAFLTGYFKKIFLDEGGRKSCLFSVEGSSRARLIIAGDSVVTALPRDKIFSSPDAQAIVAMMEGVRLLDSDAFTIDDVIAYRGDVIESNKAPDKNRFRRNIRGVLEQRLSSTRKPSKIDSGLEPKDQPVLTYGSTEESRSNTKTHVPLSFEAVCKLEYAKLEELAEIGLPDNRRHVCFWDQGETIQIVAFDKARIIASGYLRESAVYQLFFEFEGAVYRIFSRFQMAVENYKAGDIGIYAKDYGEHLYLENPEPHREFEVSNSEGLSSALETRAAVDMLEPEPVSDQKIKLKVKVLEEFCLRANEVDFLKQAPDLIEEITLLGIESLGDAAIQLNNTLALLNETWMAAHALSDAVEDSDYFQDRSDVDDSIMSLLAHGNLASESVLARRMQKTIREFNEMKPRLPERTRAAQGSKLRDSIASLDAAAPACTLRDCGAKMTIREGNGEFFWGCTKFPDCWGKRQLSRNERDKLPD